jgi:hypothetical protein
MLDQKDRLAGVLDDVRAAAPAEDRGRSPQDSVEAVRATGVLSQRAARPLARTLVRIAEANLPVARYCEGHVNALRLLRLHGAAIDPHVLYGIWGADGERAVRLGHDGRLVGEKRYCSGLGLIDRAILTVGSDDGVHLAVVDAREPERLYPQAWNMLGMRATLSGRFTVDGLVPDWLGGADAFFQEPSFLGGTWRIAALQAGGTLGLLGAARDRLAASGRLDAEAQLARLGTALMETLGGLGQVERAAEVAEGSEGLSDPDRAVALSLGARLQTEETAQRAIQAVERSIGLVHFDAESETGRIARDLATYCRQAARDAFLQKAAGIALRRTGPLSELWHG